MGVAQFSAGQRIRAIDINQLPVVVNYLTTGTVANTTAETVIGTFTIPAGDPTLPGGYWWTMHLLFNATGSPTITVRLRFNGVAGTQLSSISGTASGASGPVQFQGWLGFESIGTAGNFAYQNTIIYDLNAGAPQNKPDQSDPIPINTTVANTLVITAQFSVANAGNNASTRFGSLYRL